MNEIETLKVLNYLKRAYPHIERDRSSSDIQEMFETYADELDTIDPLLLKVAARQLAHEVKWFPSISELCERVHSLEEHAQRSVGTARPTADEAWQQISAALHPFANGFEWDSERKAHMQPIVIKAAELFGEFRFATRKDDDAGTDRAQFRNLYNTLLERAQDEAQLIPEARKLIKDLADKLNMGKRLLNGGDHAA